MQRAQGFAQQGDGTVWTNGSPSTNVVQTSYPFATISVFYTGTASLAVIFGDNNTPPTALANPFTANADGYWWFYAPNGRYDVMMQAPDLAPWTISDLQILDANLNGGGVYSWYEDVNANGNSLWNLNRVQATCLELGSGVCAMYLCSTNCELSIMNASGGVIGSITQQGEINAPAIRTGQIQMGDAAGPNVLTIQAVMRSGGYAESVLGLNTYWDGTTFTHVDPAYPGTAIVFGENTGGEGGVSIDYLPVGSGNLTTLLNATMHSGSPYVMLSAGSGTAMDAELINQGQWYTYAPNNTQLIFRMRGNDGVFREAVLNLS